MDSVASRNLPLKWLIEINSNDLQKTIKEVFVVINLKIIFLMNRKLIHLKIAS